MALVWDSQRNGYVDDGKPSTTGAGSPSRPSWETDTGRSVLGGIDTGGEVVLDAYGLHSLAQLIHNFWKTEGLL